MIFPDVNILIYAYDKQSHFHTQAARWLENVLTTEQVYFSWQTITGFLRITTNPRASTSPLKIEQAVSIVDSWLQIDSTHLIHLEKKNWPMFTSMLIDS